MQRAGAAPLALGRLQRGKAAALVRSFCRQAIEQSIHWHFDVEAAAEVRVHERDLRVLAVPAAPLVEVGDQRGLRGRVAVLRRGVQNKAAILCAVGGHRRAEAVLVEGVEVRPARLFFAGGAPRRSAPRAPAEGARPPVLKVGEELRRPLLAAQVGTLRGAGTPLLLVIVDEGARAPVGRLAALVLVGGSASDGVVHEGAPLARCAVRAGNAPRLVRADRHVAPVQGACGVLHLLAKLEQRAGDGRLAALLAGVLAPALARHDELGSRARARAGDDAKVRQHRVAGGPPHEEQIDAAEAYPEGGRDVGLEERLPLAVRDALRRHDRSVAVPQRAVAQVRAITHEGSADDFDGVLEGERRVPGRDNHAEGGVRPRRHVAEVQRRPSLLRLLR